MCIYNYINSQYFYSKSNLLLNSQIVHVNFDTSKYLLNMHFMPKMFFT